MTGAAPDRARAMAARIDRTAERLGVAPRDRDRIRAALDAVFAHRARVLPDDHHPDFLHPARSALILMDDVGVADAATLTAAVLAPDKGRVAIAEPTGEAGQEAAAILDGMPGPDVPEERLLESLLAAPPAALLVALAERLDQARHLHLRDRSEWQDYHRVTCAVYAPLAARTHPVLERRFDWWCRTFQRRFLGR